MKIAGLIVLYHPGFEVINNIQSYLREIEKLFVVDNSEPNYNSVEQELIKLGANFRYIVNSKNLGIAKALNQGIEAAVSEGFEWLLTMDQDSYFTDNLFFRAIYNYPNPQNVAIFTQKFISSPYTIAQNFKYSEVEADKTSGNLLSLSICEKIGGFQDDLFIDDVDTEYCYRVRQKGFKIILFENIYLVHQFGTPYKTKSPFTGKEFYRFEHPPYRYYYNTRNLLIVSFKYLFIFPGKTTRKLIYFPRYIYGIIMYENNRISKLGFVLKGICHFFIGRKGSL